MVGNSPIETTSCMIIFESIGVVDLLHIGLFSNVVQRYQLGLLSVVLLSTSQTLSTHKSASRLETQMDQELVSARLAWLLKKRPTQT